LSKNNKNNYLSVELLFRNRTPSHPPPLLLREQLTYLLFSSALLCSLLSFSCVIPWFS
jgi:hypothetical protein